MHTGWIWTEDGLDQGPDWLMEVMEIFPRISVLACDSYNPGSEELELQSINVYC